jgi:hypothetical protein
MTRETLETISGISFVIALSIVIMFFNDIVIYNSALSWVLVVVFLVIGRAIDEKVKKMEPLEEIKNDRFNDI